MNGNTLLGVIVGVVAGAFLVDTFQPAQDLLDNCKHEVKQKVQSVKSSVKSTASKAVDKTGLCNIE